MMMHSEWAGILPQSILAAGGSIVFCVGALWRNRPSGLLFGLALVAAAACGATASLLPEGGTIVAGMVDVGPQARFYTVLFSVITVITLLFADHYARIRDFAGDAFYGIMLFAALGMVLVASAVHWLMFFLGLELLSISLYVLIASRKEDASATEAALKYFVMGAVASAFLVFGIAVLYAATGELNMAQSLGLAHDAADRPMVVLGMSLVLVGIGFKVSLVPFHLWTPDVYQGAPAPVTAFLSTGSKVALFAALLRIAVHAVDANGTTFVPVLWIIAALTMVIGNVTALTQDHLKRLLAYSSVAHMGYLLMALLAVRENGVPAIMFYSAVYAIADLGAFGTVGLLSTKRADLDALDKYPGLGYAHPWPAILLTASLFSLAGLPATAGFIGKFVLFQAVLEAGFVGLAVLGMVTVIISVYYYLRVIVALYMREAKHQVNSPPPGITGHVAAAAVLLLILWLGLAPSPLLTLITRIVAFPYL
jgi:NADH-quinone oxidoreductase subunit N